MSNYPIVTTWDCYDPAHPAGALVSYRGRVHVVVHAPKQGLRLAAVRPSVEAEIERLRTLLNEVRQCLPSVPLEEGDDPEWLADLKQRAADVAGRK